MSDGQELVSLNELTETSGDCLPTIVVSKKPPLASYCVEATLENVCKQLTYTVFAEVCVGDESYVYELDDIEDASDCSIKVKGKVYYKPNCSTKPTINVFLVYQGDCKC